MLPWSNNFVFGCKKAFQEKNYNDNNNKENREIQNVSLYWGGSLCGFNFGAPSRSPSPLP